MLGDNDPNTAWADRRVINVSSGKDAMTRVHSYTNPWIEEAAETSGFDVARYWRIFLKHRWVMVGCVAASLTIGIAVTLLMTPIFLAEATLKIDRETNRVVNVEGVEPREQIGASEEFYQTQYGLLRSRTLALDVVDQLGLATSDTFFATMGRTAPKGGTASNLAERRRLAANIFADNLAVSPVRGSRLVKVGFSSPDPQLSARISNTTADAFIASNLNTRYNASGYARQFLENKLQETKEKLEKADKILSEYATREGIINVGSTTATAQGPTGTQSLQVSSLIALNSSLAQARGERIKAEERWRQSRTAAAASLPEVLQNPTIQELSQARAKLEAEYQDKARTYRPEYPDLVAMRGRISEFDRQIQQEMGNIQDSLKINYDIALNQEKSFEGQVNKAQGATLDMGNRSIQYNILQREADTYRSLYDTLLQRYKEVGVVGGISTNNISVVDKAEVPVVPAKPKALVNLVIAVLAGLGLGIVVSFLLELLDESVAAPEDIEEKLGVPLLGSVPKLAKGELPLDALKDPRSAFSEAYYSIRTALQFSTAKGAPSSLLITSSRPAEGKSTSSLAIAQNFARVGIRVLLVDGDMRNPSMHRHLAVENTQGLSNVLTGALTVEQASILTAIPSLHFIPCGPLPPNPAELLAGSTLAAFLDQALRSFDMVVIDGPPVLGLADAPTLAAAVDGTVFVVESRGTRRGLAKSALLRLQVGHARVLGGVLTKFDAKKSSYGYGAGYAYAYEYSYGAKPRITDS